MPVTPVTPILKDILVTTFIPQTAPVTALAIEMAGCDEILGVPLVPVSPS